MSNKIAQVGPIVANEIVDVLVTSPTNQMAGNDKEERHQTCQ